MESTASRPTLEGVKVVEFAHLIAGPIAGTLMADLGADVVHVEAPQGGDAARRAGPAKDGVGLWWKVAGRNKRSVTIDLRGKEGQDLARELVAWADVVITNFRYDTLVKWGLDWESLKAVNNQLVMLQITGHGATSTLRNAPGFGKVGEAMSGVVQITGFPDGPPVHTGFSHADTVTGLMGAFAVSAALTRKSRPDFDGEWIDLALYDTLYRLIEWQVIVHDQLGQVPTRAGNSLFVAPGAIVNSYLTKDGRWLTVTSATPQSVRNIATLLGESTEDFATVDLQNENARKLDAGLRTYIAERTVEDCMAAMNAVEVVASPIYSVEDILEDQTYQERESLIRIDDSDLGSVLMQGVVPKMHQHPGSVWRPGPQLGEDNELVFRTYLGMGATRYEALAQRGVILP